jgi:uncharacterized protein (TIGR03437 family)
MLRAFCILIALTVPMRAQFFGLATPADGSTVYFATTLRLKNTTQPDYGKLFRVDAGRLSLQESRSYQAAAPLPSGIAAVGQISLSNAYDLQAASVSSDGQVLAATARRDCLDVQSLCAKRHLGFVTTITASGSSRDYADLLRLSANGKWAFGGTGTPHFSSDYGYLVNLTTGEQTTLSLSIDTFQVAASGRPVANDGTAVFSDSRAVVVLQGSQVLRIPTQNNDQPVDAVIDAGARTVVYSVIAALEIVPGGFCICGNQTLRVAAVGGESALLAADGHAPSLSDDGRTVLYLSSRSGTQQAWLIHTDGSGDRQLTQHPLGITSAILSGDGSTAYAVTLGGQLLKIAAASGEIEELIPRTPYVDPGQTTAPGKLTTFTGEGLSDFAVSAAPPLPYTLDSVQVTLQGKATRILAIQPTLLTVLTPPDVTLTLYPIASPLLVDAASFSPFSAPSVAVYIVSDSPEFLLPDGHHMLAAHEDWSALVTAATPAHLGEIVHAYAVGLGATSPAVPYGAPAPAQEPLARLPAGYTCVYLSGPRREQVQILYQGLAPNLAGIYQVDWRIPLDLTTGDFGILCQLPNGAPVFAGLIPVGP